MGEKIDPRCHIGEVHGIYTIVDMLDEKDKYGHWVYKGVCNKCGYIKFSHYGGFSGPTSIATQCKHLRADGSPIVNTYNWTYPRIKSIFAGMLSRCYNTSDKSYKWYGERGVKICQEWMDNPKLFEEWSIHHGYKKNLTIDRINSDEDYCPENCQWISLEENSRKAGKVNWITINNTTLTGRQWAEQVGLGILTVDKYIRTYGLEKTKELIVAILNDPLSTKYRKSHQTWFSVYGIKI